MYSLFTSVETLPPYSGNVTRIGVVVAVTTLKGQVAPTGDPKSPMAPCIVWPWTWKVKSWHVWRRGANQWDAVATAKVISLPPGDNDQSLRQLVATRLAKRYAGCDPYWVEGTANVKISQDKSTLPAWHGILADAAQTAYPIPYLLNLAAVLEFSGTPSEDDFFVSVPEFEASGISYTPANPQQRDTTLAFTSPENLWKLDDVGGGPVVAYCKPVRLPQPVGGSPVDRKTLWISPPKSGANLHADWIGSATERLASLFDLPAMTLAAVRAATDENIEKNASQNRDALQDQIVALRSFFIGSLRDVAGPGSLFRANGVSLLDDLSSAIGQDGQLEQKQKTEWTSWLKSIGPAAPTQYNDLHGLEDWRGTLRTALGPNLANSLSLRSLVNSPPRTPRPFAEDVAELSQIHNLALSDSGQFKIMMEQWRRILKKENDTSFDILVGYLSTRIIPRLGLASKSLQAQIAQHWPCLIEKWKGQDPTNVSALAMNVGAVVQQYFLLRANQLPTPPDCLKKGAAMAQKPDVSDDMSKVTALLSAYVKNIAQIAAIRLFPTLDLDADKRNKEAFAPDITTATPVPPPLVFSVMDLAADDAGEDPLFGMRGVGVLLRRVKPKSGSVLSDDFYRWRVLNIASVKESPERPLLVASRLAYDRGLRTALLSYNNGPLPVSNQLQEYSDQHVKQSTLEGLFGEPLLQLEPFEGTDGANKDLSHCPGLYCGDSFETLFFAMTNTGVMPVEIAHSAHPAKLAPGNLLKLKRSDDGGIKYARTVKVGAVSIEKIANTPEEYIPQTDRASAAQLPRIPSQVWPRAREVELRVGNAAPRTEHGDSLPLIFLVPQDFSEARLGLVAPWRTGLTLRVPNVDLQTWDRWSGRTLEDQTARALIIDEYLSLTHNGQDAGSAARKPISDPAVGGLTVTLWVKNQQEWEKWDKIDSCKISYPELNQAKKLDDLAQPPTEIEISTSRESKTSFVADVSARSVIITVEPGEVYELEIQVNLVANAKTRFAAICDSFEVLAGLRLLVEAATPVLPTEEQCKAATRSTFAEDESRLTVGFAPPTIDSSDNRRFRHVQKAEFMRQVWYWTGRVQRQSFPNPKGQNWEQNLKNWELPEFAERPDLDHLLVPATEIHRVKSVLGKQFEYSENLQGDLRALYFRFATRIYSRYEGVFTFDLRETPAADPWVRQLVPCRAKRLDVPKIKALFPLTESTISSQAPGLMVVLDGPSYEQGGLAELLNVEIAKASDPTDASGAKTLDESGPDPIAEIVSTGYPEAKSFELVGPIGHSFDDPATRFPAFTSSSYIIRPTVVSQSKAAVNPAWWFVKLRFWRSLNSTLALTDAKNPVVSEKTSGSWMQFLPGFVETKDGQLSVLEFRSTWIQSTGDHEPKLQIWYYKLADDGRRTHRPSKYEPTKFASPGPHFRSFIILSRSVFDITGREDQEVYVGVYQPDDSGLWTRLKPPAMTTVDVSQIKADDLRARIVEVQWHCAGGADLNSPCQTASGDDITEQQFWDRLFGTVDEIKKDFGLTAANSKVDLYRARIVRVSPLIRGGPQTKQ